jgi:hypothetical protein
MVDPSVVTLLLIVELVKDIGFSMMVVELTVYSLMTQRAAVHTGNLYQVVQNLSVYMWFSELEK